MSVMSPAIKFNETKNYRLFREWMHDHGGVISDLPPNTFRESGTDVNSVLLRMTKR